MKAIRDEASSVDGEVELGSNLEMNVCYLGLTPKQKANFAVKFTAIVSTIPHWHCRRRKIVKCRECDHR